MTPNITPQSIVDEFLRTQNMQDGSSTGGHAINTTEVQNEFHSWYNGYATACRQFDKNVTIPDVSKCVSLLPNKLSRKQAA